MLSHSAAKMGSKLFEGIAQAHNMWCIILLVQYVPWHPNYTLARGIILANTPHVVMDRSL